MTARTSILLLIIEAHRGFLTVQRPKFRRELLLYPTIFQIFQVRKFFKNSKQIFRISTDFSKDFLADFFILILSGKSLTHFNPKILQFQKFYYEIINKSFQKTLKIGWASYTFCILTSPEWVSNRGESRGTNRPCFRGLSACQFFSSDWNNDDRLEIRDPNRTLGLLFYLNHLTCLSYAQATIFRLVSIRSPKRLLACPGSSLTLVWKSWPVSMTGRSGPGRIVALVFYSNLWFLVCHHYFRLWEKLRGQ